MPDQPEPKMIVCLNCHGRGFQTRYGIDGIKRPIKCRGCYGTGEQRVRGT